MRDNAISIPAGPLGAFCYIYLELWIDLLFCQEVSYLNSC